MHPSICKLNFSFWVWLIHYQCWSSCKFVCLYSYALSYIHWFAFAEVVAVCSYIGCASVIPTATCFTRAVWRTCEGHWWHSHWWSSHKWRCCSCHWNSKFLTNWNLKLICYQLKFWFKWILSWWRTRSHDMFHGALYHKCLPAEVRCGVIFMH